MERDYSEWSIILTYQISDVDNFATLTLHYLDLISERINIHILSP